MTIAVNTRVLPSSLAWSASNGLVSGVRRDRGLTLIRDETLPFRSQRHILACFFRKPLALVGIEQGLARHPPDHAWTKIVFAVETLHPIHQLGFVEPGVDDLGQLVAGLVRHVA